MSVSKAQYQKIALSFPGAIAASSYGKPSVLIGKKFFTRWRDEENSIVLIVDSIDERDMLLEADPKTFFITEHYRNYPSVLANASKIDAKTLRGMLERRWQKLAPKRLRDVTTNKKSVITRSRASRARAG
ncbi:MAG: MmcQ/YjbR family DNA-binding protein [Alphaproteobacteria bacterium]|nr:MmcQ/YjbR family DNA-binding protein [Alphaproteobacteria bacterium]MBV9693058.1 MmcQ/YjbR family DNA-binding protein [Alphaproteobacteria bacterium]